jgi:hypothetical protein
VALPGSNKFVTIVWSHPGRDVDFAIPWGKINGATQVTRLELSGHGPRPADGSMIAAAYTNNLPYYLRSAERETNGGEFFRRSNALPVFRLVYEGERWHVRPTNIDCWLQQLDDATGPQTFVSGPVRGDSFVDLVGPTRTSIRLETTHFKYVLHQPEQSTVTGTCSSSSVSPLVVEDTPRSPIIGQCP